LNSLCATSSSSSTSANDPDQLSIKLGEEPAATLAPAGAGNVPFTTFILSAGSKDVMVNSITAERGGLAEDAVFDSVSLNDENSEIGDDQHFDANHRVFFKEAFTVPAHSSKTLTIQGNMASDESDYAGQMPMIQVDAIDATSPVVGSLPLKGTAQTVNSTIVIGGAEATLSAYDPGAPVTHYINDKNVRFAGIRLTANSQEDVALSSITWTEDGTAGSNDLSNVVTVINGVSYPATVDGRTFTSNFSPAITITKGQAVDIYAAGDLLVSGAGRTVKFDINGSDDISLTGNTFGFGVGVSAGGNTATDGNSVFITSDGTTDGDEGTPFFSASTVTINGGSVGSIQNAI
jgi:hypothetical protein